MPYGRQRNLRPIKTDKHEVTWSNLSQNASSSVAVSLVTGVNSADKNASNEVEVGSQVKGIYLEFHFGAEVITSAKVIHWIVICRPSNLSPASITPSLYYQVGRKYIIKRGMEMLPKSNTTLYKRIIFVRIPKVYHRIGISDSINFVYICTSAETINACGIAIYKEFY